MKMIDKEGVAHPISIAILCRLHSRACEMMKFDDPVQKNVYRLAREANIILENR